MTLLLLLLGIGNFCIKTRHFASLICVDWNGLAVVLLWSCSGLAVVLLWFAVVLLWYCSGLAMVLQWSCSGFVVELSRGHGPNMILVLFSIVLKFLNFIKLTQSMAHLDKNTHTFVILDKNWYF